jgi:hypothetical protein
MVSRTKLNLDGSPMPGSLVLAFTPATVPEVELATNGHEDFTNPDSKQAVDLAVADAIGLLNEGRLIGPNADEALFLSKVSDFGPRVASTLRDFTKTLVEGEYEPEIRWMQPRVKALSARLSIPELTHIGQLVTSRELAKEPATIRGKLRTVSDISSWKLEVSGGDIVSVVAKHIPQSEVAHLRLGMTVKVAATVTEEVGPSGSANAKYVATSFEIVSES